MDYNKDLLLIQQEVFTKEFEIKQFKESLDFEAIKDFVYTSKQSESVITVGVWIAFSGKGNSREDCEYVTFSVENFGDKYQRMLNLSCSISMLDVEGINKLPRSFEFRFAGNNDKYTKYSERYVERSCILNSASEYLQNDSLTIIMEGTLEEWIESGVCQFAYRDPENYDLTFKVIESPDLKVYLRKDSTHANRLIENSSVFRDMWHTPMRESLEECVLLLNNEILAFLCMPSFIDTNLLLEYRVTIFDLYKIADKYYIPVLLVECRKRIRKFLSDIVSFNLNFIRRYDNKCSPQEIADKYSSQTQVNNPVFDEVKDDHSASK